MELDRRRERLLLFVLTAIQFCHMCDFVLLMPLGPQLMRVMSLSPAQFGFLVSSYTWSAAIAGFFASLFVDRFDRKPVLLFCYAGFLVGTALCGMVDRYHWLLLARVVAGAFGGSLVSGVFAIVADVVPESRRGAATGRILSAFSMASVLGIPFGLWLAAHYRWSLPFLVLAALGAAVWVLAFWQLPPLRGHLDAARKRPFAGELRYVITHPNHVRAYLLTISIIGSGFLVIPFISPFLVNNVGVRESQLPYVYLTGGAVTFFTSRYLGVLTDRFGAGAVFLGVAFCSTIPLLLLTHLSPAPLAVVLPVTSLFFVLVSGRWVPAMTLITSASVPRVRGSFLSFNSSLQQVALGMATFLSGHILGQGPEGRLTHYRVAGWLAVACTLASIWLAWRVSKLKIA